MQKKKEIFQLGTVSRIKLDILENNTGQIDGVPKNPRYLKKDEHDSLKNSLIESPEFLEYKPLMVFEQDGKFVTICGNMRLRICQELRQEGYHDYDTIPSFILNPDTPVEKIKEYAIKDNEEAGDWDWEALANDGWGTENLTKWGVDCSFLGDSNEDDVDALFEEVEGLEEKKKDIQFSVHIPEELKEKEDEIKEVVKAAVAEYEGVKIK